MITKILKVMLWGREVGRLCIDPRRKLPYFEYNREWVETGLDISPLNASIKLPQNLRPIFGASEKIYQKLPPFLTAELEIAYYEMATRAGIRMMPCWLIDVEGEKHFVTKRFDRDGEKKLHMQTLAALYPEADSYERLLWVCRKMRLSEHDSEEVFRRMVFNLLANNTDDHNKNFSFLMDEQGRWCLAPAYDMTYIFNTGGFQPETRHCLMIRGKLTDITLDDAMQLAAENGIRKAENIIHEVTDAIREFRPLALKQGAQERWIAAIEHTLKANLEAWGLSPSLKIAGYTDAQGRLIENVRIELQFKGNYHLLATINGEERKYVIRKKTVEHDEISRVGVSNLSEEFIKEFVARLP